MTRAFSVALLTVALFLSGCTPKPSGLWKDESGAYIDLRENGDCYGSIRGNWRQRENGEVYVERLGSQGVVELSWDNGDLVWQRFRFRKQR